MIVYAVKSYYLDFNGNNMSSYTEDIFSSVEGAADFIASLHIGDQHYAYDSGLDYENDMPVRAFTDIINVRQLIFKCECLEVK